MEGRLNTLVDGVFDPLHDGHIAYFKAAYDFGLPVICNISRSRKRRTILTTRERASVIGSCRWISDVTMRPTEWALGDLDLKYYVKGSDWIGNLPQEQLDICKRRNIEICYTMTLHNSSTHILKEWMGSVDGFEAQINAQVEPEPWKNTYSLEERRKVEGKHPQLIRDVFKPKFVFDAGCGPSGILVRLLTELGIKCWGIDSQYTRGSSPRNVHISLGDLIYYELPLKADRPDLVICREVLEHMPVLKIQKAVENLCRLTRKYVYVTTRFGNDGLFRVGTELDVDPTHISCLDKDMLRLMFVLQGMRRRKDLEMQMDWMNKGRVLVYEKA